MRWRLLAAAAAWVVVPVVVAEPIASAVFDGGLFGLSAVSELTPAQALLLIPEYLWYFPGSAAVWRWAAIGYGVGLSVIAIPAAYLAYAIWIRRRRLREARPWLPNAEPVRAASKAHGDADWLSMEDAHDIFPGEHEDWAGIPVGEAYRPDKDTTKRPFVEDDPATWGQGGKAPLLLTPLTTGAISGIIIAGSGSMKTVSFTVPAMLTWRGSAVVLDPSTQVGDMVAGTRRAMGQQVAFVDPSRPGYGFNVLGCIDLADPLATVHLAEFIDWCGPPQESGKGGDKNHQFFVEAAKELCVCILADMLWDESIPRHERTVKEWRRRIVTPEQEMKKLLEAIYARSASQYARDLAATMMRTFHETFSSIYKQASSDTKWLSIPAYADLLSGDAFDPADLTRGKLTVIVQIPDEAMIATPAVARVVIGALARTVLRAKGRVATPIPFILDEMDLLKNMPILAVLRDMGRKSGAALFPMWQSTGQIERTWGQDGKKSWYASAAWRLYAAVNDDDTAREVSARCGSYTVLARAEGTSISTQNAMTTGSRTRGYTGNISEQRRELLSPYEAQTELRPDEAIIIPKGRRALRCGRPLFWRRPEMAGRVAADPFRRKERTPA